MCMSICVNSRRAGLWVDVRWSVVQRASCRRSVWQPSVHCDVPAAGDAISHTTQRPPATHSRHYSVYLLHIYYRHGCVWQTLGHRASSVNSTWCRVKVDADNVVLVSDSWAVTNLMQWRTEQQSLHFTSTWIKNQSVRKQTVRHMGTKTGWKRLSVDRVEDFYYLWSVVTNTSRRDKDIKTRINKTNSGFKRADSIWRWKYLSGASRIVLRGSFSCPKIGWPFLVVTL